MEFLVHNISHSDMIVELTWLRPKMNENEHCNPIKEKTFIHSTSTKETNSTTMEDKMHTTVHDNYNNFSKSYVVQQDPDSILIDGNKVPTTYLARPKFSFFEQISKDLIERVNELRGFTTNKQDKLENQVKGTKEGESLMNNTSKPTSTSNLHASIVDITTSPNTSDNYNPDDDEIHSHSHDWKAKCTHTATPVGFRLDACPIRINVKDVSQNFIVRDGIDSVRTIQSYWKQVAITAVYFPLISLLIPKWLAVLKEFNSDLSKQMLYLISGAGIPRNSTHSMNGNSTEITAKLMILFINQFYPHIDVFQVHSGSNIFRFDGNVQFMVSELRPLLEAYRDDLAAKCGDTWKKHFHVTIAYTDGPPARLSALNAALRLFKPSYLHIWQLKTFWHERKLSMEDVDFHSFNEIEASPWISYREADTMTQQLVSEMRKFRDEFIQAEAIGQSEFGTFWLRKSKKPVLAVLLVERVNETTGETEIIVHRGVNCEVSMPTGSLCAERNAIGGALAHNPSLNRRSLKMIGVLGLTLENIIPSPENTPQRKKVKETNGTVIKKVEYTSKTSTRIAKLSGTPPLVPLPAPKSIANNDILANDEKVSPRRPKRPRTVSCDETFLAVHSTELQTSIQLLAIDRNPLAPCGACKEWLLKIAQANPSFKVVTFETDRCRKFQITQLSD